MVSKISDRLIVTLLIIAILLSVFSIVMTLSLSVNSQAYNSPEIPQGNTQANVEITVAPNPLAGEANAGAGG
ncbi:hypothetical protein J4447_01985 [Candidatus Pacearchaeota archaeon]|nr:hypothetical protein [Candidatus Pacearchaeota archaeon]